MEIPSYLRSLTAPAIALPEQVGSTLILSSRQIADFVGYAALYEFEDMIAEVTGAGIAQVTNNAGVEALRKLNKLARTLAPRSALPHALQSVPGGVSLHGQLELFLPVFNHVFEVYALGAVRDWRKRCKVAACYLGEAWNSQLPSYLVEQLREFDHIFVGVQGSVETIGTLSGRPCTYLPRAVDALRFCPHPELSNRQIDVCNVGRRASDTHAALLELARTKRFFYYYDTMRARAPGVNAISFSVIDHTEHRELLAALLGRSRYFIANRAVIDQPELTGMQQEISGRFYEGAAAGAVMLGDPPDTDEFRRQFFWQDAIIPVPFHAPHIGSIIAELDRDPARLAKVRQSNVVNALRHHDWVYRLRSMLDTLGLPVTPGLVAREQKLWGLAAEIEGKPGVAPAPHDHAQAYAQPRGS